MTATTDTGALERWRTLVLAQAETIRAHDETIRALIRETDSLAPYTGCLTHGAEIAQLIAVCGQLEQDERAADAARAVYALSCVYLEFLKPASVAKITPPVLAEWVAGIRKNAARKLDDPDEREYVKPASTVYRASTARSLYGPHRSAPGRGAGGGTPTRATTPRVSRCGSGPQRPKPAPTGGGSAKTTGPGTPKTTKGAPTRRGGPTSAAAHPTFNPCKIRQ